MKFNGKKIPEVGVLNEILMYDTVDGKLYWKKRSLNYFKNTRSMATWNGRYAGTEACGCVKKDGYKWGKIFDVAVSAHRVVWKLKYGFLPDFDIDHINKDKLDNRIENLRISTYSENSYNKNKLSNNTSGYKGVDFNKSSGAWSSRISIDGIRYHLGLYSTAKEAGDAYDRASMKYHGEFSYLDRNRETQ